MSNSSQRTDHHASRSDPTHFQSGLTQALDKLGRTRGSSATPAPSSNTISPAPKRGDFNKQIAKMSDVASSRGDDRDATPRPQGQGRYQSPGMGGMSANYVSPLERGRDINSAQQNGGSSSISSSNVMIEFSQYFQKRLIELKQSVNNPGIPPQIQEQMRAHINSIGQEFNTRQRTVQSALNEAFREQARIQGQLDQMEGQVLEASLSRDKEQIQATEWKIKKQKSSERLHKTIHDLRQEIADQTKKLAELEEKLNGNRAMWSENRPTATGEHRTGNMDPFNSPLAVKGQNGQKNNFLGMMNGPMGAMGSPTSGSNSTTGSKWGFAKSNAPQVHNSFNTSFGSMSLSNASHGDLSRNNQEVFDSPPVNQTPVGGRLRRRGAMPSGNPAQQLSLANPTTRESIMNSLASLPTNTEPGSPEAVSRALVLRGSNMSVVMRDPCPRYEAVFAELFKVAEAWCVEFAAIPNLEEEQAISHTNPSLWTYMISCVYPTVINGHQLLTTVLQDPKSRFLFATRLTISYFVTEVFKITEFESFSPDTEATLTQCKKALQARGLANEVRQTIVDRQCKAIKAITEHEGFEGFRNDRLLHHTARLRDLLGSLLSSHVPRNEAGKALGKVAAKAFDAAVAMHTSNLTFQINFPDSSSKLNPSIMTARDIDISNTAQIQISQIRLKLVITPIVTLRDDHGSTIRVKNLHKAQVLTMSN